MNMGDYIHDNASRIVDGILIDGGLNDTNRLYIYTIYIIHRLPAICINLLLFILLFSYLELFF